MNRYSTFSARLAAAVIDWVLFLPLGILHYLLEDYFATHPLEHLVWLPVYYGLYQCYSVWMHGTYGQTIGKRLMRIRIVSYPNETPIGYSKALLRDLPYLVFVCLEAGLAMWAVVQPAVANQPSVEWVTDLSQFALSIWLLLEIATILFNEKRRAVHDLLAGTVVVFSNR
jgi:uncharacterized RDD family membrane protein YckC